MDKNYLTLLAGEAFLRRVAAAQQDFPFMLKGSFLTRQYLPNLYEREVNDLDWVYVGEKIKPHEAGDIFLNWINAIIQADLEDGVKLIILDEDAYWENVYYAMADEYPTINIELCCSIFLHEKEIKTFLSMDFTFNLPIELLPVALLYKSIQEEDFLLKYTTPLALQIAWKLHQTIVRPRVKDIEDLIQLLQHPSFDKQIFQETLQTLVNECQVGKVKIEKLDWFMVDLDNEYYKAYENFNLHNLNIKAWKKNLRKKHFYKVYRDTKTFDIIIALMNDSIDFAHLSYLLTDFRIALNNAGFTIEIWKSLPKPN